MAYNTLYDFVDVWGEGRIIESGLITGFEQAYNINKFDQRISNGVNKGKYIPNLLPVKSYDMPDFPISDGSVSYLTLMGAPIISYTAREMYRVLEKTRGVVILFGPDRSAIEAFEGEKQDLIYKPGNRLGSPFDEINIRGDNRIYGFPGIRDHDEL